MSNPLTGEQASLREQVKTYLEHEEAPAAYELLEAQSHLLQSDDLQLLYCEVLLRIGRFEKVEELARRILESDPTNDSAAYFLQLVSSATVKPSTGEADSFHRDYASSIPQPFLGRLQDAVHHYRYKGIQMVKSPFDIALYPLMIWDLKPRTIIEIGSKEGGSALWLADQIRNFNLDCRIHSIDLIRVESVQDPLVSFYRGNGRSLQGVLSQETLRNFPRPWLVIEDADHSFQTSYAVLNFFDPWLYASDIIVVEDGIMSDLYPASFPDSSSGPHLALKHFLGEHREEYKIEAAYCDFFGHNVTWSSNGILRRLTAAPNSLRD